MMRSQALLLPCAVLLLAFSSFGSAGALPATRTVLSAPAEANITLSQTNQRLPIVLGFAQQQANSTNRTYSTEAFYALAFLGEVGLERANAPPRVPSLRAREPSVLVGDVALSVVVKRDQSTACSSFARDVLPLAIVEVAGVCREVLPGFQPRFLPAEALSLAEAPGLSWRAVSAQQISGDVTVMSSTDSLGDLMLTLEISGAGSVTLADASSCPVKADASIHAAFAVFRVVIPDTTAVRNALDATTSTFSGLNTTNTTTGDSSTIQTTALFVTTASPTASSAAPTSASTAALTAASTAITTATTASSAALMTVLSTASTNDATTGVMTQLLPTGSTTGSSEPSATCKYEFVLVASQRPSCNGHGWLVSRNNSGICSCSFGWSGTLCEQNDTATGAATVVGSDSYLSKQAVVFSWPRSQASPASTNRSDGLSNENGTVKVLSFAAKSAFTSVASLDFPRPFINARLVVSAVSSSPGVCEDMSLRLRVSQSCDMALELASTDSFESQCYPNILGNDQYNVVQLSLNATVPRTVLWEQLPAASLRIDSEALISASSCGCKDWRNATFFLSVVEGFNRSVLLNHTQNETCTVYVVFDIAPACSANCSGVGSCPVFGENPLVSSSICDCRQPISGRAGIDCSFVSPHDPNDKSKFSTTKRLAIADFGPDALDIFSSDKAAASKGTTVDDLKRLEFVGEEVYHRVPTLGSASLIAGNFIRYFWLSLGPTNTRLRLRMRDKNAASANPIGSVADDDDETINRTKADSMLRALPGTDGKYVYAGFPVVPALQVFVFFSPDESVLRNLAETKDGVIPWWIRVVNSSNGTAIFDPISTIQIPTTQSSPYVAIGVTVRTELPVAWQMFTTIAGANEAILQLDLDDIAFTESLALDSDADNFGNTSDNEPAPRLGNTKFNTRKRALIVVVPTGLFDMRTSSPVSPISAELLNSYVLEIRLEDTVADVVNVLFGALYFLLILLFCACWRCCNPVFHWFMALGLPELYVIKRSTEQQTQIRDKYAQDISKFLKMPSAAVIISIIGKSFGDVGTLPDVTIPKSFLGRPNVPLREVLGWLANYMVKDVDLPVVRVDGLTPFVAISTLVRSLALHIPDDLTIPMASLRVNAQLVSPVDLLKGIELNYPNLNVSVGKFSVMSVREFLHMFHLSVPVDHYIPDVGDLAIQARMAELPAVVAFDPTNPLDLVQRVVSLMREFHVEGISPATLRILLQRVRHLEGKIPNPLDPDFSHIFANAPRISLKMRHITLEAPPRVELPSFADVDLTIKGIALPGQINASIDVSALRATISKTRLTLVAYLIFGILGTLLANLLNLLLETISMLFSISLIHSALADIGVETPDLSKLLEAFEFLAGLAPSIEVFQNLWKLLNIVKLFDTFNCGGVLTMISPIIFFLGASIVWIILQKDILLWLGIKLRMHNSATGQSKLLAKKFWEIAAKVSVRAMSIAMQSIVYALAQAAIYSTTARSCSDIDFVANTFGKSFVAFFFVVYFLLLTFAFTGAPDLRKYEGYGVIHTWVMMFVDGMARYVELTLGIWTDATIRGYNILGRAARYKPKPNNTWLPNEVEQAKQDAKAAVGLNASADDSLHEQTMRLIAASRNILWIPLPAGAILTKFSETLNLAHIFIFAKNEHLQMRRPFYARLLTWIFASVGIPLQLGVIFSTSEALAITLFATLIPINILRLPEELDQQIQHFKFYWNVLGEKSQRLEEMCNRSASGRSFF